MKYFIKTCIPVNLFQVKSISGAPNFSFYEFYGNLKEKYQIGRKRNSKKMFICEVSTASYFDLLKLGLVKPLQQKK